MDLVTTSGQPVHDGAGSLLHRHQTGHGKIIFGGERRLDKAGADQGYSDPFAGQIEAQGIRQIVECCLGGTIRLGPRQRQPAHR